MTERSITTCVRGPFDDGLTYCEMHGYWMQESTSFCEAPLNDKARATSVSERELVQLLRQDRDACRTEAGYQRARAEAAEAALDGIVKELNGSRFPALHALSARHLTITEG